MKVKVTQWCRTLSEPLDHTVLGILQARILEWVAFPFSRGSSQPRDQIQVSGIAGGLFTSWDIWSNGRKYLIIGSWCLSAVFPTGRGKGFNFYQSNTKQAKARMIGALVFSVIFGEKSSSWKLVGKRVLRSWVAHCGAQFLPLWVETGERAISFSSKTFSFQMFVDCLEEVFLHLL